MSEVEKELERYGSFHEDLVIGVEQTSEVVSLSIQRRKPESKLEDQIPIRNAKLTCRGVMKFDWNVERVVMEFKPFTTENTFDLEIVDLVLTANNEDYRIEVFWDGYVDNKWCRNSKFDILAASVSLEFSDV